MSPFVFVIFGATGDLAQHKLLPALFSLYKDGQLGQKFYIVGFARRDFTDEAYAHMLGDELELHKDEVWQAFAKNIYYQQGFFDQEHGYQELILKLNGFDAEIGACITRVFYLATPPDNYETILQNLDATKLSEGCGPAFAEAMAGKQGVDLSAWTRLAIEKPFGKDLNTARELDRKLSDVFEEKQIYRVDHYLGKETVQNMLAFRFANSIFEPVWNNRHIDNVQITFAEKKGIGTRGKFFDGVGMLRDVAQNHLLQLFAAVAMDQPKSFTKESVRDERAKAIKAIRPLTREDVLKNIVRGQYSGYMQEKDVSTDSRTETFAAMKLFVDNDRFADVPFYLRAGKEMERDLVEIKVIFKQTCHILFKEYGCPELGNVLTIRIQPDEGITLRVMAKNPGTKLALQAVDMNFSYHQTFGHHGVDAYEKIMLDILKGDQILFNRSDELDYSWTLISQILEGWTTDAQSIPTYKKGSWGPQEAFDLIEKDGRTWL
ncbi:MAG: glucose-6-phosphate dehydrogenase [Candidatus Levybacteria bacterium]|nr:glucose-6-phosphate dehydrogenase [Candidatus Levybacteria bacterium]